MHINVRFYVWKKAFDNREIILKHCPTTEFMTDTLTEPLGLKKFNNYQRPNAHGSISIRKRNAKKAENNGQEHGHSVEAGY